MKFVGRYSVPVLLPRGGELLALIFLKVNV